MSANAKIDSLFSKSKKIAFNTVNGYVEQVSIDTASQMLKNFSSGTSWEGGKWKKLFDGYPCHLDDYGDMKGSSHKDFLKKSLWAAEAKYEGIYPQRNMGGGSYAELHQTGNKTSSGIELPRRPWHPADFEDLNDFDDKVIEAAFDDASIFFENNFTTPLEEALVELQSEMLE